MGGLSHGLVAAAQHTAGLDPTKELGVSESGQTKMEAGSQVKGPAGHHG